MRNLFVRSLYILSVLCIVGCSAVAQAQSTDDLHYLTESYFPYNYEENGQLKGLSVELLRLVWEQMGMAPQPIEIMPWARGYKLIQMQPGTVLFSMARTDEREGLFRWVGPIQVVRFVLKAKKSRHLVVEKMADLHGRAIGTLRDDVADVLLDSLSKYARIETVPDVAFSLEMLRYDRIDLIAYEETSFDRLAASVGMDPSDYETVFVLKETGVYYAFHSETDQALVARFQSAFDAVRARDEYTEIMNRYLSEPMSQE